MRLAARLSLLVVLSGLGGAFRASAQTPTTPGIVIRERVEVARPAATSPVAARPADDCGTPIAGEAIYRSLPTRTGSPPWVAGDPLSGTLTVETTCGAAASGALSTGFSLRDAPPPGGTVGIYSYDLTESAIVRVPLQATEGITRIVIDLPGDGFPRTLADGPQAYVEFGCNPGHYNFRECLGQSTYANPGGHFGIRREITGWATGSAHAWPDSVACGTTTALPMRFTKADGSEGYVGPGANVIYGLFAWGSGGAARYGGLIYNAPAAASVDVPYGAARSGGVSFVAPACEGMTAPTTASIGVNASVSGASFDDHIQIVPPPPTRFAVTPSSDTLAAGGQAWVTSVAVSAVGTETYLDPETPVTLSVSRPDLGMLVYSWRITGAAITVPYNRWLGYYAAGARPGVWFRSAQGPQPTCDSPVSITASGGGISGSTEVVILGSSTAGADTLVVSVSPGVLAPGDSAVVSVVARSEDGCDVSRTVPDSTRMSVASFAGPFGLLEHDGVRSRIVSDVTWGELRAGEVRFVATGAVPCAADTVGVLVSGAGLFAAGSVVVQGSGGGSASRSANEPICTSRINLVETKDHLTQAFRDECPNLASADAQAIEKQYERTLTEYLFGGMGWGPLPEYTYSSQGLDGYLRWAVDTAGRRYPQVGTVMESKMTDGRPVNGSDVYIQATNHINFLADQRTAFRQAFLANHPNGITFTFGDPTLIYVSQNQGSGREGWRIGNPPIIRTDGPNSPDYDELILDHANRRHVAVIHARMVYALGYRTLIFRYRTPLRVIDPEDPFMDWLSSHATVDARGLTFSTLFPVSLECGPNPTRQESPPPPGWNP